MINLNNFTVNTFNFISNTSLYDIKWDNWSRCYEYELIINKLNELNNKNIKIHNSACGATLPIHKQFADYLKEIGYNILNSDNLDPKYCRKRPFKYFPDNFINFNIISDIINEKFDIILNISTIEHFHDKNDVKKAIFNLLSQLNINGKLLLTFDYPDIDINYIEKIFNIKCKDCDNRLNGSNSILQNNRYKNLNIVYLEIQKNN
jgi:hypothetical protein